MRIMTKFVGDVGGIKGIQRAQQGAWHSLKAQLGVVAIICIRIMEECRCLEDLKLILQPNNHFISFILYGDMFSTSF